MQRIVFVGLILCMLSGCAIFRTRDVTVSNNSDYKAYISVTEFRRSGDLSGSSGGVDYIELLAHSSTTYKLYDNGDIKLTKSNRNFLKNNSNTSYEVQNSPKKVVKVFNKTGEKITLSEENNLFDTIKMSADDIKDIDVFTLNDFSPYAINEQGLFLEVSLQNNFLVITF